MRHLDDYCPSRRETTYLSDSIETSPSSRARKCTFSIFFREREKNSHEVRHTQSTRVRATTRKLEHCCTPARNSTASATDLKNTRHTSRLRLGELLEEVGGLVRPFAPNFSSQDDQSCSAVAFAQLGVGALLTSLASSRAAPSTSAYLLCGCPSPRSGDTNVVSMASCAPPPAFGHLPALCPEPYPGGKRWLKLCHPPPYTLLLLHSQEHTHDSLEPLPSNTLRGGGHKNQVDAEEGGAKGDAKEGPEIPATRISSGGMQGNW